MMGGAVQGFEQSGGTPPKLRSSPTAIGPIGQNAGLRRRLLDTGAAILAEAIPRDYMWGIGLAESDPDARHVDRWKGQNLLGQILATVRGQLQRA